MVLNGRFVQTDFPLFYEQTDHLIPLVIWKLPTNHHWVVAWLLLDANCPVLLTRGGIHRKGLTAQWLQQFASSTEVSTLFAMLETSLASARALPRSFSLCDYFRRNLARNVWILKVYLQEKCRLRKNSVVLVPQDSNLIESWTALDSAR